MAKVSIQDCYTSPEAFLYVFATDEYIARLGTKAQKIITQKRANQNKILLQSAAGGPSVESLQNALREGFIQIYGQTPADILIRLANGETVCGKNYSDGVYGVGAIYQPNFVQNNSVLVDEKTGQFIVNGTPVTGATIIYGNNCPDNIYGYSWQDEQKNTYSSRYVKTQKKYYAGQYMTADGTKQTPKGTVLSAGETGNIWETVIGYLDKLVQWIISIFGGASNSSMINSSNTLPSQTDGFVEKSEAGLGTWGTVLLALAAVGTLLAGKKKK